MKMCVLVAVLSAAVAASSPVHAAPVLLRCTVQSILYDTPSGLVPNEICGKLAIEAAPQCEQTLKLTPESQQIEVLAGTWKGFTIVDWSENQIVAAAAQREVWPDPNSGLTEIRSLSINRVTGRFTMWVSHRGPDGAIKGAELFALARARVKRFGMPWGVLVEETHSGECVPIEKRF